MPLSLSDPERIRANKITFGVVIVAAGRGERAGSGDAGPKQYRLLGGETVIARTVGAFRAWNADCPIVVVRHADDGDLLEAALGGRFSNVRDTVGGATRQASGREGLRLLSALPSPPTHVLIHDAARPFVSVELLETICSSATGNPESGVIPVLPISETIKQSDGSGEIVRTVPRDNLFRAQTPQLFPLPEILDVHERAVHAAGFEFTDDASLYEWASLPVRIVPGDSHNIKLTYARDFEDAERMLKNSAATALPDIRVGHGYDTHQLIGGKNITLCGVTIPHHRSLSGHSDADVGLHALTDALLAMIGAGDIGSHFPPSDPRWKGANSEIFLRHAAELVRAAAGAITHCDVTLVCEEPKIGPHRDAMRAAIARIVGLAPARVSVKATTNEGIGFVGRGEGIAALATATAVFSSLRDFSDE